MEGTGFPKCVDLRRESNRASSILVHKFSTCSVPLGLEYPPTRHQRSHNGQSGPTQRMAWYGRLLLFLYLSLVLLGVEGGRFGGRGGGFGRGFGGGGRYGGRSSSSSTGWGSSGTSRRTNSWGGSWGGRSSSFGSRYSAPTGRYSSYTPPVTRSYTGGYGRWVYPRRP